MQKVPLLNFEWVAGLPAARFGRACLEMGSRAGCVSGSPAKRNLDAIPRHIRSEMAVVAAFRDHGHDDKSELSVKLRP